MNIAITVSFQFCYRGLDVQGQGQDFFLKAKVKDTNLFQGQLQGQAEIRIGTTK